MPGPSDIPFLLLLGSKTGGDPEAIHHGVLLLLGNTPPFTPITASDTLVVIVNEGTPVDTATVSTTDTATVIATDVVVGIVVQITSSDTLVVGALDGDSTEVALSASDTITVAVTETTATQNQISSTDNLVVIVNETSDVQDTVYIVASDTITVQVIDEIVTLAASVTTSDTLIITADGPYGDLVFVTTDDTLTVSLVEAVATQVRFSSDDTLTLEFLYNQPGELVAFNRPDAITLILLEHAELHKAYLSGPPPEELIQAILSPFTRITRRVDVYESDGTTIFMANAPFTDGNVNVDMTRDERRTFDLKLVNREGALTIHPDGMWYDKIIKIYRGVETPAQSWERQLGEFLIDSVSEPHFPHELSIQGRDATKLLLLSKFPAATSFAAAMPIETLIHTIAVNGGISPGKIDLPLTGQSTAREFPFDRGTERWAAIKEIANAYGYDVYFTNEGILTMSEWNDPTTGQPEFTFQTGVQGNIVDFQKSTSDARLFNHVVVSGESTDTIPVWAQIQNDVVGHPTSVARVGQRSFFFTSAFIETQPQALDVATKFLKINGLEQFEVSIDSIVLPWLEAGSIVDFVDPDPADGDPTRYLFSNFTVPLLLKPMPSSAKRVTVVV